MANSCWKTRFNGALSYSGLLRRSPPSQKGRLRAKKKKRPVSQKKLTHARQRENGRPSDSRARRGVEWRRGVDGAAFRVCVGGGATKSTDFVETQPATGCDTLNR